MKDREFEGLVKLFLEDEDKARAWLDEHAGELNRQITEAGLVARSAVAELLENDGDPAPLEIGDDVISEVARVALESEAFSVQRDAIEAQRGALELLSNELDELTALVTAQQATIDLLTADDDAKRQRYQDDLPPQRQQVVYRPSRERAADNDNGAQGQLTAAERATHNLKAKGVGGV